MSPRIIAAAIAGAILLPAAAQAQTRVAVPQVELFDTVKGKWVLDPRRCNDIREDFRDARVTTSLSDRREDRQDQRVAACPASAYTFVPNAGQGPKYPVRVSRGPVPRSYRGKPMFINGDTIGKDDLPVETVGQTYAPNRIQTYTPRPIVRVPQPPATVFTRPTVTANPQYQQPTTTYTQPTTTYVQPTTTYTQPTTTYVQPTYTQPAYQQPAYQAPAPAPAPAKPSNYEVRNGVIYFLD